MTLKDRTPRQETVLENGSRGVARVYAESLLDVAAECGQTDQVLEEFGALIDGVFPAAPEFETFLAGSVNRRKKAEVVRRAFDGRVSDIFRNFLLVVNAHRRLDLLRGIRDLVKELYDERAGRLRVLVTSAVPLPDHQRERLRQELRAKYRKEPILTTRVEPDLLGGLVVRVGDWLYDASLRTRLETVRKRIIERGSHVTI
jgi:F-type H+-transporting ATPase subunit delta